MDAGHRARLAPSIATLLGILAGCDALLPAPRDAPTADVPAETSSATTPAAPVGVAQQPSSAPAAQPPAISPPPVRPPAIAPGAAGTEAATASGSVVALSTGVALQQTLPEGTAIGVSVEYEFIRGAPASGARYALVVQPARGGAVELPVQLEASGTILAYTYDLRPDQAPFTASLHEFTAGGETRSLSESVKLR